tara:strand:+ start:82 stop:549 length:468 start_codon:yes stop_codon:yes gene_type:complete
MLAVGPYFTKHNATRGASISEENQHEAGTYPYPLLTTLATQDNDFVYSLTRVINENYDEFKDADPGAIGWAIESQVFDWVVPYHDGAVNYWREVGVWTDEIEAHNQALIQRQEVLAAAWTEMEARGIRDKDAFVESWQELRAERLEAAGFDPVWR